jgi:hypothetical protein
MQHALLDRVGAFPHIIQLKRPKDDAIDANTPEGLPMQLVALEANQLRDAKA